MIKSKCQDRRNNKLDFSQILHNPHIIITNYIQIFKNEQLNKTPLKNININTKIHFQAYYNLQFLHFYIFSIINNLYKQQKQQMKNYHANKILPLTIKDFKKAQIELKAKKQQVFQYASYEIINVVSRIVKLSGLDIILSDQTNNLQISMYHNALRKSVQLQVGKYYRLSFVPTKSAINGGNFQQFGFQVVGIKKIHPNQITLHITQCLTQKISRQMFRQKQQNNCNNISSSLSQMQSSYKTSSINTNSQSMADQMIVSDIKKYCRNLSGDIELQKLSEHFNSKYLPKQIQNVLLNLCEQGVLLNLGLAYEWVEEEL